MQLRHILTFFAFSSSVFTLQNSFSLNGQNATSPLPKAWPKAPWTFAIHDGFIEFEFYNRRLRDPTKAITQLVQDSLLQIRSDIRWTFYPSHSRDDNTWTFSQGVARFELHLEPETPATKADIVDMFAWILYLTRRWNETSVEIGNAVLFVRGKVRAYCSLTLPGIVNIPRDRYRGDSTGLRSES
ncbi:MAG: hypothetical protein Q9172_004373 [Xanthocarpia lactea]